MAEFENTYLWKSTLAKQNGFEKERDYFRVSYQKFRTNAGLLAAEISRDLPDYTVHDLTHLDALWEIASIICGEDFYLNPAEAFVLGGAFLIHDLGMGLAAYPDGIDALRKSPLWDDTISYLSKNNGLSGEKDVEKEATGIVLRALHAKHAEKLALISWGSEKQFLIADTDLREAYGSIIGLIAYSHWWNSSEIINRLPQYLGALGNMPNEWGIDPIKLACIMRASDAAHIDSRRAPAMLKALRKPGVYAQQHWLFQQRLYQPRVESERLVYTSKTAFSVDESKSWWLCFDTLKMIDQELRDVDSILGDTQRVRLKAKGVAGVNNLGALTRLIGVEGWHPVDATVRVGNVAKLVRNLGGEQLYGENITVPLRELIQNASDAIAARRLIEAEVSDWGIVTVRVGTDKGEKFVEVEDNGVGMSMNVLTGPFIDFGSSFWGTSMMHNEFPGLEAKGFSATGKYGVGFFSTFMWGGRVTVTTRRFEDARQDTKVLMFENGLEERPILKPAPKDEYIKDGGTRVRVYITNENFRSLFSDSFGKSTNLSSLIEYLCPCANVTILAEDLNEKECATAVVANDWKLLNSEQFLIRVLGRKEFDRLHESVKSELLNQAKNIRDIVAGENILGRGFICNLESDQYDIDNKFHGIVTVGGFRATELTNMVGLFVGAATRASRDAAAPLADGKLLADWATVQSSLIKNNLGDQDFELSCFVRALGGYPGGLYIARHGDRFVDAEDVRRIIGNSLTEIIITSTSSIYLLEKKLKSKISLKENVFVTNVGIPGILQTDYRHGWFDWPSDTGDTDWFHSKSLEGIIIEIFAKNWHFSLEDIKAASSFSDDELSFSQVIGTSNGVDIADNVDIIRIPKTLA